MSGQKQEAKGGETLASTWNSTSESSDTVKQFTSKASTLPFGQSIDLASISGPTYLTAQTLVQQVAYSLSDKIYTYSPESFSLDVSAQEWASSETKNAHGSVTSVSAMQTRSGAGSIALGYMFSKDFDLSKRHIPQALIGSASSIHHLRPALDQLSLLYSVANPFVAHIAAVDYASATSSGLVTDYISSMSAAEDLGLGLVASASAFEAQHMSLFSTLLASVLPTIHVYDGIKIGRDTLRIVDTLDQNGLKNAYNTIEKEISGASKKAYPEARAAAALKAFNNELGTQYELFEYHGHASPEAVLVVFGTVEASLATQVVSKLADEGNSVGLINVRVYRPFAEEAFIAALPASARTVAILGQVHDTSAVTDESVHSSLYTDVLAALTFSDKFASAPAVIDSKYAREQSFTPTSIASIFLALVRKTNESEERIQLIGAEQAAQYTFWDLDASAAISAPTALGKLLSAESADNIFVKTVSDNLVQGGATRTDIRSSKKAIETAYPVEEADVVVVGEEKLLSEVAILSNIKVGGKLIVKLQGAKDEDVEKKLPDGIKRELVNRKVELYILDPAQSAAVEKDASAEALLFELAFLSVAREDLSALDKLAAINGDEEVLKDVSADVEKALRRFEVPSSWAEIEVSSESELPKTINNSSFVGYDKSEAVTKGLLRDWQQAAKGLLFKEAYGTVSALRPDLPVTTYEITVKENRRLTPATYDRNIFHIEFDLGNSGLKYDIGEALGIHAQNDSEQVSQFIADYDLSQDDIVEVPSLKNPDIMDTRTVYQSLMQNIDIFGKPPKRFYEALAEFATEETERKELLTLGGSEGANEFKRRAEVDTVTYADILLEFKSARPSFHEVARIVEPMKRREYSIASSQMVNPSTVALMIVVVSWVDPKGRDRFGQATRYLSGLPIGATITASVKPSVMKLPKLDSAPLIMAGLGTGLAPFRAFVQHRALQKAQGKEIGSILLYMGSRHQREEYLYGEEWEAYQDAGVITLLGRAFSRDQPQKIYIQDRMRESIDEIIDAYIKDEGSFYLCGPTWPVPDVTEVLEEAISKHGVSQSKKVDSRKEIERLKEDGRYVLEVY